MTSKMETFLKRLKVGLVAKSLIKAAMNTLLRIYRQHLFINVSVENFLFKGYTVNILETIQAVSKPLKVFKISLPAPHLIDNRFGLFYPKNSTASGPFEVYTNAENLAQIRSFNFQK